MSVVLPALAALWGAEWGCGGIVEDSRHRPDGGPGAAGETGGSAPVIVTPPSSTCGNGYLDPGEQCDGIAFAAGLDSCAAVTMGMYPAGTLKCTVSCTLSFEGCSSAGAGGGPSFAGGGSIGGSFGQGGFGGTMGFPSNPTDDCYAHGGVPDPTSSETCNLGADATNACIAKRSSTTCTDKCACSVCPSLYDHCMVDGACRWMFACAQQGACYSVASCEPKCPDMIKLAGGPNTPSAALMDSMLACLTSSNCPLSCP